MELLTWTFGNLNHSSCEQYFMELCIFSLGEWFEFHSSKGWQLPNSRTTPWGNLSRSLYPFLLEEAMFLFKT